MKRSKTETRILSVLCVLSLVLVCTSVNFAAPRRFMSLATASLGGTYYIIGSAIADVSLRTCPASK